jgi:hypothetical protein
MQLNDCVSLTEYLPPHKFMPMPGLHQSLNKTINHDAVLAR